MLIVLRNIFALVVGLVAGSAINMGLILLAPSLIPPPAGVDMSNAASIGAAAHLFEPRHFVMPFLAHALGTFVGALVGYCLAPTHRAAIAYVIAAVFLAGGIAASFMIPAPKWFLALDLIVAYIPMAWLGQRFGRNLKPESER